MEVIGHSILVLGDHVNLVGNCFGYRAGDLHDEGVVGDVARIENSLLVVKVHLIDTTQVLTHKANDALRRGLSHQLTIGVVHVGFVVRAFNLGAQTAHIAYRR